jgi:aryl-alcohol dehydrogenase-like predicted oxidoreductase
MEYRRMGRSGLQLSVLSFGSWVTFHKQINDNSADELMGIAYDNGINFFDNAEVYALGESEKMMGRVLKAKNWDRTSYTISSKAFFGWRGKENKPNQTGLSRKHLTEACHEALQRLQTDYLDLYFCHRPDKNTPIEEVVLTMNNLIQQGKILYWGQMLPLPFWALLRKEQLIDNLTALKAVELLTSEVISKIEAIMQNKPVLAEY